MNNEIVEAKQEQAPVAQDVVLSATEVFTGGGMDVFSSVPAPVDKLEALTVGAENLQILNSSDSIRLSDKVNTKINIVMFVAGKVEIKDMNTEQVRTMLRVVMKTDDGALLSTVSPSAVQSLGQYSQFYNGNGLNVSEETPLPLIVKSVKTNGGFTATVLDLDSEEFGKMIKKLAKDSK